MLDGMFFSLLQAGLLKKAVAPESVGRFGQIYIEARDGYMDTPMAEKVLLLRVIMRADDLAVLSPEGASTLAVLLRGLRPPDAVLQ